MSKKNNAALPDLATLDISDVTRKIAIHSEAAAVPTEGNQIDLPKSYLEDVLKLDDSLATLTEINKVQKTMSIISNGTALGLSRVGTRMMLDNKDVAAVSARVKLGKDKLTVNYSRERQFPGIGQGAEPSTKYGVVNLNYVSGAASNAGEYKKIKGHINEMATSLFGPKA